jgi:hypothetical protein
MSAYGEEQARGWVHLAGGSDDWLRARPEGHMNGSFQQNHQGGEWPEQPPRAEPPQVPGPRGPYSVVPPAPSSDGPVAGAGGSGGPGGPHGPGGSGGGSIGTGGGGEEGDDEGDSAAESALRRMLHDSVRDIEPAPQSLDYLRHAIPARRANRRRALAGAAAAVVLAGVGVPTLASAGLMPGISSDRSINAADSHGQNDGAGGQDSRLSQGPEGALGGAGGSGQGGRSDGSVSPSPSAGKTDGGANGNDNLVTSAPSCTRQQLGSGTADVGNPASDGKIYGSFRVENTSGDACAVEGDGVVGASAHGEADIDRINVVDHTPGDAAVGLPDPDESPEAVVLRPGEAYLVKFAWIPSECPKSDPSPKSETGDGPGGTQGGSNGDSSSTGGSNGSGGPGEPGGGDGGTEGGGGGEEDASVVLTHTPDVGDPPAADTTLDGECAGTLYRTGVLSSP